jgi:hypothetical protein
MSSGYLLDVEVSHKRASYKQFGTLVFHTKWCKTFLDFLANHFIASCVESLFCLQVN